MSKACATRGPSITGLWPEMIVDMPWLCTSFTHAA